MTNGIATYSEAPASEQAAMEDPACGFRRGGGASEAVRSMTRALERGRIGRTQLSNLKRQITDAINDVHTHPVLPQPGLCAAGGCAGVGADSDSYSQSAAI